MQFKHGTADCRRRLRGQPRKPGYNLRENEFTRAQHTASALVPASKVAIFSNAAGAGRQRRADSPRRCGRTQSSAASGPPSSSKRFQALVQPFSGMLRTQRRDATVIGTMPEPSPKTFSQIHKPLAYQQHLCDLMRGERRHAAARPCRSFAIGDATADAIGSILSLQQMQLQQCLSTA